MRVDRRTALQTLAAAGIGGLITSDAAAQLKAGLCGGRHVAGFTPYCLPGPKGQSHQIYVVGESGPPVLLLHELPGLVVDDLDAARRIATLGYRVVMPLFFGKAGGQAHWWTTGLNLLRVCDQGEFACRSGDATSPHVPWLRELCGAVRAEWPDGRGLAAIGMCLTGAFPIALLSEPSVTAAVLCQPTIPFNGKDKLGLDPRDLELAKTKSQAPVLGLRYTKDSRCPPERFRRLVTEFGDRFYRLDITGDEHSTLAFDYCQGAFDEVSALLNQYLRTSPDASIEKFPHRSKPNSVAEVSFPGCDDENHHA